MISSNPPIFNPTNGLPVIIHPKAIVSNVPTILQLNVFKIVLVLEKPYAWVNSGERGIRPTVYELLLHLPETED